MVKRTGGSHYAYPSQSFNDWPLSQKTQHFKEWGISTLFQVGRFLSQDI